MDGFGSLLHFRANVFSLNIPTFEYGSSLDALEMSKNSKHTQNLQNLGGNPSQNCENLGQTSNPLLKKSGFLVVKMAHVVNPNA